VSKLNRYEKLTNEQLQGADYALRVLHSWPGFRGETLDVINEQISECRAVMATRPASPEKQTLVLSEAKPSGTLYSIGYQDAPHSYGMAFGPTPNLGDMLDVVPGEDRPAFIFQFKDNSEKRVYHWNSTKSRWQLFRLPGRACPLCGLLGKCEHQLDETL
jgi:hypothetical protein